MDIYELEKTLKAKAVDSSDDVIKYALLETLSPIADYTLAITILKEHFPKYNDFRMAVLISFLMSTWENYKENDFISTINSFLETADGGQKAIIYYLNAYDIFMHDVVSSKRDEYLSLLNQSVNLDQKFVYNYYRLAQRSKKDKAKELIEKALSHIEKISSENDCESMTFEDFISFDAFLKEHILGTILTQSNFEEIKNFYNNC